jgi:tetratricopeptide (TPR) repeat protein
VQKILKTSPKWIINMLFAVFIIALLNLSCQSNKITPEEKTVQAGYKGKYETLLRDEKYDELHEHLKIWESKEANNPEVYMAYFNYYINKDFIKAVEYLDKGLSFAPNRLDMRFRKIDTFNKIGYYKDAGNELYTTLKISKEINNNWLGANNEKMENGESFFFSNIGDYYQSWFDAETEEALEQVKQCVEKQIELYSGDIFTYDVLGIYYYVKGQFQETLRYFLQAEMIDPNDCITLMKVGQIYLEIGDKQKAQEYFTKILKIGNEEDKEVAEHFLSKLR